MKKSEFWNNLEFSENFWQKKFNKISRQLLFVFKNKTNNTF